MSGLSRLVWLRWKMVSGLRSKAHCFIVSRYGHKEALSLCGRPCANADVEIVTDAMDTKCDDCDDELRRRNDPVVKKILDDDPTTRRHLLLVKS